MFMNESSRSYFSEVDLPDMYKVVAIHTLTFQPLVLQFTFGGQMSVQQACRVYGIERFCKIFLHTQVFTGSYTAEAIFQHV